MHAAADPAPPAVSAFSFLAAAPAALPGQPPLLPPQPPRPDYATPLAAGAASVFDRAAPSVVSAAGDAALHYEAPLIDVDGDSGPRRKKKGKATRPGAEARAARPEDRLASG